MDGSRELRGRAKRLEKLMASGLMISFAQRVAMSFAYLDLAQIGSFSLKDLAERGRFVFSYLHLPGPDSSFAIMDAFRQFDRGTGAVGIDEFGAGVVERIYQVCNNSHILRGIAKEVIPGGKRSLADVLQCVTDVSTRPSSLQAVLGCHADSLIQEIKQTANSGTVNDSISTSRFVEIIQRVLERACAETCVSLHLSIRTRHRLQDESLTGYHYLIGDHGLPADLRNSELSRYCWVIEAPDSNADDTHTEDDNEEPETETQLASSASAAVATSESVQMNGEPLLSEVSPEEAIRLDNVQIYLLRDATEAIARFMSLRHATDNAREAALSVSALSKWPPLSAVSIPSGTSESLMQCLLDAQDRLRRAEIRLQVHERLQDETAAKVAASDTALHTTDTATDSRALISPSSSSPSSSSSVVSHSDEYSDSYSDDDDNEEHLDDDKNDMLSDEGTRRVEIENNVPFTGGGSSKKKAKSKRSHRQKKSKGMSGAGNRSSDDLSLFSSDDDINTNNNHIKEEADEDDVSSQDAERNNNSKTNADQDEDRDSVSSDGSSADLSTDNSRENMSPRVLAAVNSEGHTVPSSLLPVQPPSVSFEDVMSSIEELHGLIGYTARADCVMGALLEQNCAIVPMLSRSEMDASSDDTDSAEHAKASPTRGLFSLFPALDSLEAPISDPSTHLSPLRTAPQQTVSGAMPKAPLVDAAGQPVKRLPNIALVERTLSKLKIGLTDRRQSENSQDAIQLKYSMATEKLAEYSLQIEQMRKERDEAVSLAVEVQVLREKNFRLTAEEQAIFNLQQKNSELNKTVSELTRSLKDTTDMYLKHHHEENARSANRPSGGNSNVDTATGDSQSKAVHKLNVQLQELIAQRDKLIKDNQRVALAAKQSDQRMKAVLQDHISLRQKLNKAEDDLMASKTVISNLLGEIDHERNLRSDRDMLVKKSQELHMEVVELRGVVLESKDAVVQLIKAKEDITRAEDQISLLEERLADITKQAELSNIGQDQLDNLRAVVAEKSKENRELVLQCRALERRLQELQGLETRHSDVLDELNDYKFKVDQIPPLLAELARLKGSYRAMTRTMHEQDKMLSAARARATELEAENARLKAQNRVIDDLKNKLAFAEIDSKRYLEQTKEIPGLKAELKKWQEDFRGLDSSHRKIKKIMRQAAIVGAATGAGSTTAAVRPGTPLGQIEN